MSRQDKDDTRRTLELYVLRAGGRLFAIRAAEVEATAEGLTATPLPRAPEAVVGVVSLRGRVRTALNPLRLVAARDETDAARAADAHADKRPAPRFFVALKGDDQLALACDGAEAVIEVASQELTPTADAQSPALGTFTHGGLNVTLLDAARLFDAAMQGTDRRRRRS
ncbi:MAG: chemotaxis protein CheW [Pyrinomonadaceae bacterium]